MAIDETTLVSRAPKGRKLSDRKFGLAGWSLGETSHGIHLAPKVLHALSDRPK